LATGTKKKFKKSKNQKKYENDATLPPCALAAARGKKT
jgi:hypothetical protein